MKVDIKLQLAGLERKIDIIESEINSLRFDPGFVDTSVNNCELTATNLPVRHDPPLLVTAKAFISALGFQVGLRSFSVPVTFGGSVWVRARTASSKIGLSRPFRYGSDQIRGRIQFEGKCNRSTCGSVAQW